MHCGPLRLAAYRPYGVEVLRTSGSRHPARIDDIYAGVVETGVGRRSSDKQRRPRLSRFLLDMTPPRGRPASSQVTRWFASSIVRGLAMTSRGQRFNSNQFFASNSPSAFQPLPYMATYARESFLPSILAKRSTRLCPCAPNEFGSEAGPGPTASPAHHLSRARLRRCSDRSFDTAKWWFAASSRLHQRSPWTILDE